MSLISITDIQNLDPATPDSINSRLGSIVDVINGNLDAANLADAAVTAAKLASDAVTTNKILNDAVTPGKWTNPYCFKVYETNNYGVGTSGDKFPFRTGNGGTTEIYDYQNMTNSDGVFTAPFAGVWNFNTTLRQTSGSVTITAGFYKNGVIHHYGDSATAQRSSFGTDILLAAGDTIEVVGNVSASTTFSTGVNNSYFGGHLVHKT